MDNNHNTFIRHNILSVGLRYQYYSITGSKSKCIQYCCFEISFVVVSPAEIAKFSIYLSNFLYILRNFHLYIHSCLGLTVIHRVSVSEPEDQWRK